MAPDRPAVGAVAVAAHRPAVAEAADHPKTAAASRPVAEAAAHQAASVGEPPAAPAAEPPAAPRHLPVQAAAVHRPAPPDERVPDEPPARPQRLQPDRWP